MYASHKAQIAAAARKYLNDFNVTVIPLGRPIKPGMTEKEKIDAGKRPDRSWEEFQDRRPTHEEASAWNCENLGLVTGAASGIIVVDCESREDAKWFFTTRGQSTTIVQTPRGFHFYFQTPGQHVPNAQRLEGRYDVRGDGGYVVAPPSIVNGKQYKFVEGHGMKDALALPKFQMEWRYPPGANKSSGPQPNEQKTIRNGAAYIRRFRATSGQGGHSATYKAVCYLKESGMGEADALATLIEWNQTNCDPPWTTAELLHKVKGVYK
ncbi:bifunctional DNA primase/polymerase [Planctomicrobium sp. SH661]|uniref:bifunctional DNA primase/polymerase n=1 Tax=Planctomicrobium sp. SH661 TaxID=3448124 RepID=UPI003F5C86FF